MIVGSPEDCIDQLDRLDADRLGPIVVRPAWRGMEADSAVPYLDALGERVVEAGRA